MIFICTYIHVRADIGCVDSVCCIIITTTVKWLDPEEKERLMQLYNVVPTRSNSRKQNDLSSQAVTLARRLYMLDGFKKSEVAARLSQP